MNRWPTFNLTFSATLLLLTLLGAPFAAHAAWISEVHLPLTANHPVAIELNGLTPGTPYDLILLNGKSGSRAYKVLYQKSLSPTGSVALLTDTPAANWTLPTLEPTAITPLTSSTTGTPRLNQAAILLLYTGSTGLAPINQSIYQQQLGAYAPGGNRFATLLDSLVLTPTGSAASWAADHLLHRDPINTAGSSVVARPSRTTTDPQPPMYFQGIPDGLGDLALPDGGNYLVTPGRANLVFEEPALSIPEPTTSLLLTLGAAMLGARRGKSQ